MNRLRKEVEDEVSKLSTFEREFYKACYISAKKRWLQGYPRSYLQKFTFTLSLKINEKPRSYDTVNDRIVHIATVQ